MNPSYNISPPDSAFYNWHDDEEPLAPEEEQQRASARLERELSRAEELDETAKSR